MNKCWCGNSKLLSYSDDYYVCQKCNTLVSKHEFDMHIYTVENEEQDLYGENYWQNKMAQMSGFDNMNDIIDDYLCNRCVHWLKYLLEYVPIGKSVAEVGCGLGQFAYLCKLCGYKQDAFELSEKVCSFIKKTYDVNITCGELAKSCKKYDVVMGFDLFEHIINPHEFLDTVKEVLVEDGMICFQLPCYNPQWSYAEMQNEKPEFERLLVRDEHVFLYSKESIVAILSQHGFGYVEFEPAFFGENYDMFLFASSKPIRKVSEQAADEQLDRVECGRLIKALLKKYELEQSLNTKIRAIEKDSLARMDQVVTLTGWVKEKEKDLLVIDKRCRELEKYIEKQKNEIIELVEQKNKLENEKNKLENEKNKLENEKNKLENEKNMYYRNVNSLRWNIRNICQLIKKRVCKKDDIVKGYEEMAQIKTIALDLTSIRPDGSSGGANGFAIELTKGLAEKGYNIVVLSANWNTEYLKSIFTNNVSVIEVIKKEHSRLYNRIINKLNRMGIIKFGKRHILKDNHVDVLCCPFSAATYAEDGIPVVSTILDIQHEFYPTFFDPKELQGRRNFYKELIQKVDVITCISDYTKDTFCEKYDFPRENAHTIYIAIQDRFTKFDDNVLDKFNIKNGEYIVYPANFWEHKNHKMLLTAFGMYHQKNKDAKLVLTGNPLENEEYYNQLLKGLGIDQNVVITKYLKEEELFSILKHSKGLVFPSLFEGFGIPVVEAMYLGKLIACSNKTSLPEIGCEAIFYFDPRKADDILEGIKYLYDNVMTDSIQAEYDEKLKEYQTDKMVEHYLDVFQEACARNKEKTIITKDAFYEIYPDMWLGEKFTLELANHSEEQIEIVFNIPDYIGKKMRIKVENGSNIKAYKFETGRMVSINEIVKSDSEKITINFEDTWIPALRGIGDDQRTLSVLLSDVFVCKDNNEKISLLSMEVE